MMPNPPAKNAVSAALAGVKQVNTTTASASMRVVAEKGRQAAEWAGANPGKAAALGAGAVLVAAPMIVAGPMLAAVGFGANGIAAGTWRDFAHTRTSEFSFRFLVPS